MTEIQISTIGLLFSLAPALVHGVEVIRPLWARWVANWVLPFFAPGLPRKSNLLDDQDQLTMLDAAFNATPRDKKVAAADYIFLLLFEQRQNALAFLALAVGVVYGLTLPLIERNVLHLILLVMSVLFVLVNANQAGVKFLGNHPRVSRNGRHVGFVFTAFWSFAAILNGLGFTYAIG